MKNIAGGFKFLYT